MRGGEQGGGDVAIVGTAQQLGLRAAHAGIGHVERLDPGEQDHRHAILNRDRLDLDDQPFEQRIRLVAEQQHDVAAHLHVEPGGGLVERDGAEQAQAGGIGQHGGIVEPLVIGNDQQPAPVIRRGIGAIMIGREGIGHHHAISRACYVPQLSRLPTGRSRR